MLRSDHPAGVPLSASLLTVLLAAASLPGPGLAGPATPGGAAFAQEGRERAGADSVPGLAAELDGDRCRHPVLLRAADLNDTYHDFHRLAQITGRAPHTSQFVRRLSLQREATACGFEPSSDRSVWGALRWGRSAAGVPPDSVGATVLGRRIDLPLPDVEFLPVRLHTFHNSAYPDDLNNGAVWAGRGWATSIRAGVDLEWGPLRATVDPSFNYQENDPFQIPDDNPLLRVDPDDPRFPRYRYPWHFFRIDWPLRHGETSYSNLNWGQSSIRLQEFGLQVGFSHENVWRGPAQRYPLVLSNTASGFPHLFVGTARPKDVGIGKIEADFLWGKLSESDHFDDRPGNDRRIFANGVGVFTPGFAPSLSLGITSSYVNTEPRGGASLREWLRFIYPVGGVPSANTGGNALGSIFVRWVLPESGFEIYGEWGREDSFADLRDLMDEPDHSQAYTLGLQKAWIGENYWVRLTGELIHLQMSQTGLGISQVGGGTDDLRTPVTWYIHAAVSQGYTQRGQLLGAYIGPGSFAQYLAADLFADWGKLGVYVERVRRDDDAYYRNNLQNHAAFRGHDVELSAGVEHVLFLGTLDPPNSLRWVRDMDLRVLASFNARRNRNFIGIDIRPDFDNFFLERNWKFELGLRWHPSEINERIDRLIEGRGRR